MPRYFITVILIIMYHNVLFDHKVSCHFYFALKDHTGPSMQNIKLGNISEKDSQIEGQI